VSDGGEMTSKHLKKPVVPVEVSSEGNVSELLEQMSDSAFQGRNLGRAVEIWLEMLQEETYILLGLAGAMVPAGMRKLVVYLIRNRLIDCIVSTGANLFHDIHETLGKYHYKGSHMADDSALFEEGIDRIYDVFAPEKEFVDTDEYIGKVVAGLDKDAKINTRRLMHLLGEDLHKRKAADGIVVAAYEAGVPVYCPAVSDSSVGIALAVGRAEHGNDVQIDVIDDINELTAVVDSMDATGVIYIGGGTPKNFIQQTEVVNAVIGHPGMGHKYAIQITTDSPHWGGLSGCTFAEAQSWGKISLESHHVMVFCDATIGLPMLVTAVAQRGKDIMAARKPLDYDFKSP